MVAERLEEPETAEVTDAELGSITEATDPMISAELRDLLEHTVLDDDRLVSDLFTLTKTVEAKATSQLQSMTADQFEASVLGAGGLEARLADNERDAALAKHGLTPFNTVEGLIKLRGALVQAFRDNGLVPAEVRLKAAELAQALHVLEVKHDVVVQTELHRAEMDRTNAHLAAQLAAMGAENTKQIAALTGQISVLTAGAQSELDKVKIQGMLETAKIDRRMLRRQKRLESFKKSFHNAEEMRRTLYQGWIKPLRKWALLSLVPLIVLANLVADGPGREDTPLLGKVNRTWDAAYDPVRDGVIRVYHDFKDDAGGAG